MLATSHTLPPTPDCTTATTAADTATAMKVLLSVHAVHSDRHSGNDESASVSSILPAELWLDTLCLCAPTPLLPATSRATASQPGSPSHRIWTHRHIFLDPAYDPKVVNAGDSPARKHYEIDTWYPSVAQCESHLAYYLKAQLPTGNDQYYSCASGLAPEPGHQVPATVFSVAMVEWLFSAAGPFGRQCRQTNELDVLAVLAKVRSDWDVDLDSDSDSDEDDNDNDNDDGDGDGDGDGDDDDAGDDEEESEENDEGATDSSTFVTSPATTTPTKQPPPPPLPTWRLLPDPFLLVTFFIRTSQLDLLELTLTRLRTMFPVLLTATAPFSLWARLMLDNRTQLRSFLSAIVRSDDDPHMSYATFLCFIAIIDWSKSALDVVARVFTDSFDASVTATLITSTRHMMDSILETLDQLTSPTSDSSRVLSILNWFQVNSAHINLEDFPYLSNRITGSYPIFADVFLLHDLGNVPFLFDNPARHALGSAVAQWVINGHPDLLHVALENDLLDDAAKGRLMRHAAEKGDEDGLMATVAVNCTGGEDALKDVVLHALKTSSYSDPDPPNMYSTLLNTLITYGPSSIDPTAILTQHSASWSRRALSIMMIDLPAADALLFTWDYARYLNQQLNWAASYWEIGAASVEFMGALIDKCIGEAGMQWDELDAEKAATACALRLVAAVFQCKFIAGEEALGAVTIVDDKHVGVIEFLASLAMAKIADSHACAESDDDKKPFSSQISPGARDLLRAAIQAATSFSPTEACACNPLAAHAASCPVTNPRAIHNVIFDTLYTLDRAYLVAHVAWRHPASVRVWHRFEPAEVAKRINVNRAVGILRAALTESPADQVAEHVTGVVNGLPAIVLEHHVFVCGLRALTRVKWVEQDRREAMMSGLDASRWGDEWREHIAMVTQLPEEEDDSEEEEDDSEEEAFSLFD